MKITNLPLLANAVGCINGTSTLVQWVELR
jgi:hypothetical protein